MSSTRKAAGPVPSPIATRDALIDCHWGLVGALDDAGLVLTTFRQMSGRPLLNADEVRKLVVGSSLAYILWLLFREVGAGHSSHARQPLMPFEARRLLNQARGPSPFVWGGRHFANAHLAAALLTRLVVMAFDPDLRTGSEKRLRRHLCKLIRRSDGSYLPDGFEHLDAMLARALPDAESDLSPLKAAMELEFDLALSLAARPDAGSGLDPLEAAVDLETELALSFAVHSCDVRSGAAGRRATADAAPMPAAAKEGEGGGAAGLGAAPLPQESFFRPVNTRHDPLFVCVVDDPAREAAPGQSTAPSAIDLTPARPAGGVRELNQTQKRILTLCRRKAHKGERIAVDIGLTYGHVRRVVAKLVQIGRLRVTADGYRTM